MKIRATVALSFLFVASAVPALVRQAANPPAPPTISFTANSVKVSGVTPKGKMVWLEAAREFDDMSLRLVRASAIAVDDDGDGAVLIDLPQGVPAQSVWVAVDLTSGGFATAAPAGYPLRSQPLLPSAIHPDSLQGADVLDIAGAQLNVLLVRPGVGAWTVHVGDGGPNDLDGLGDGRLQLGLDALQPVGDSPPLSGPAVRLADVMAVVDPLSLDLFTARFGAH